MLRCNRQLYTHKCGEPRKRRVLREIEPQGNCVLAQWPEIIAFEALLALTCETCRSLGARGSSDQSTVVSQYLTLALGTRREEKNP
jgi:hypothetical protein